MVKHVFSRRDLLRAGLAGAAAAAAPAGALASAGSAASLAPQTSAAVSAQAGRHLETLSALEADTLEAIVARLIPTDANGPGAAESGVARYIDRALGGALVSLRPAYAAGLAAVESYARASKGATFAGLPPADQDALLSEMERNAAPGFTPNSAAFFNLLRNHSIQGMFCDPYYGGNANYVGWDLLGYPGVRTVVSPDQQRMDIVPAPNHKSAYDYDMFLKASAKTTPRKDVLDGD